MIGTARTAQAVYEPMQGCQLFFADCRQSPSKLLDFRAMAAPDSPPVQVVPHPTIELLRTASLSSAAQQEIERMILEGEIGPGSKLTEAWLSERLGVSRGTIREAFRMLEESGLL